MTDCGTASEGPASILEKRSQSAKRVPLLLSKGGEVIALLSALFPERRCILDRGV